jgi:ferredoxin
VTDGDRWIVEVDGVCIASGMCLGIADAYLVRGEDGKTHPVTAEVDADEVLLDAAASCPMEAIRVFEQKTGEPIEP